MKLAIFPGTFDPFTNGHLQIVKKGLKLFDHLIIAVGENPNKEQMFSLVQRRNWIEDIFKNHNNVSVDNYQGLTIQFCKDVGAQFILRGLRSSDDFNFEKQIALVNEKLESDIQSVFVMSEESHSQISSTLVRELIRYQGDFRQFVPKEVRF
tara:strand:- start:573 stop:1028 length:456 start_codon:yes stop_codon:yes gene_type:complete